MRIYSNARELMSEMGRDLWEMGTEVRPKTYQNKVIEGNEDFITKEEMCKQYCLTKLPDPEFLFIHTHTQEWADAEFEERVSGRMLNPGKAWELNKEMWEQFLVDSPCVYNKEKTFDYTYAQRINNLAFYKGKNMTTLEAVISLLKDDPDTRKAVLPIFIGNIGFGGDTNFYDGSHRIPCSMYYDFLIRDGELNLTYHQRSSDFVCHFGDDVYLAWKMKDYVANEVGVKSGLLIHTIDSLHVYKKDWVKLKTSVDDLI